jgi:hypothetical protein
MSRRISRTARVAFAALVAAGLTFGAGAALAAPGPPRCPYDPNNGLIAQSCSTNHDCEWACTQWWGSWNPGFCGNGNCCVCYI